MDSSLRFKVADFVVGFENSLFIWPVLLCLTNLINSLTQYNKTNIGLYLWNAAFLTDNGIWKY